MTYEIRKDGAVKMHTDRKKDLISEIAEKYERLTTEERQRVNLAIRFIYARDEFLQAFKEFIENGSEIEMWALNQLTNNPMHGV